MIVGKEVFCLKEVDLKKTIFELSKEVDDFQLHMIKLGFDGISSKTSLHTVGRLMTLEKGANIKGIDIDSIRQYFVRLGYKVKE